MNKTSEARLKAQKKYDDKNREKKHEYDRRRWQKRKAEHQALLDIKVLIQHYGNEEKILDIVNKALGDKE